MKAYILTTAAIPNSGNRLDLGMGKYYSISLVMKVSESLCSKGNP